jgi:succinoglycan biosynthesis transport protein ExoP
MLQEKISEPLRRVIQHPTAPAPSQAEDPRVDLKELIRIVKRRRGSILWTAAVPVLLALLYAVLATPLYTASTQILIDPRDRRIVSNEVAPEALAADGGVAVVESQQLVITSDIVLRRAIAREHLDADPEFGGLSTGLPGVLRNGLAAAGIGLDAAEGADPELKALRQLKKRVGVKRSDKAFVVDVYVSSDDRMKSVRIADALAQAYLDDQTEARSRASGRASAALGGRLDALRSRVQQAEDRVVQYKEQHKILAAGGVLVNEQQLNEMAIQLAAARGKTAEARARYEQIASARRSGIESGANPEAVLSQTVAQLRGQYAEVARQRAELGASVGPRHPSIANLDAQIQGVQKLINEELSRIASAARSALERAEANERTLEANLEGLKQSAISTNQASVQLRELEREVEAGRAVYQAFLVRARETGEQQSIDSTNARVISKATPPRDKSWPPRLLLLGVALMAGLGLGTGVGLMREYLDERVYSREALQELTGVPVLAVVPQRSARARSWSRLSNSVRWRRRDAHSCADEQAGLQIAAMRRLCDALGDAPQRGRCLLMTSATAGEGRTSTALNLALTAAASGRRILLIDADIERGMLSKTLEAGGNAGLFDLIEGRATLPSVLLNEIESGLNFLPLGNATRLASRNPNPQELAQKLCEPAKQFDLVIIDSGAVLADEYVRPFAEVVDDVVFVVRSGGPKRDAILAAIDALRINARKVRGTVLTASNDVA